MCSIAIQESQKRREEPLSPLPRAKLIKELDELGTCDPDLVDNATARLVASAISFRSVNLLLLLKQCIPRFGNKYYFISSGDLAAIVPVAFRTR